MSELNLPNTRKKNLLAQLIPFPVKNTNLHPRFKIKITNPFRSSLPSVSTWMLRGTTLLWLTVFLALGSGEIHALEECGNPAPGEESVDCSALDDISIVVQGATITSTTLPAIRGIQESTAPNGDDYVEINVRDTTITTNSGSVNMLHGIEGYQNGGSGDINITANNTTITTNDNNSFGIYGHGDTAHSGDINITTNNTTITTTLYDSWGINAEHQGSTGDINITATGGRITTNDHSTHGIRAFVLDSVANSENNININLRNITINSAGTATLFGDTFSNGVYAYHDENGQGSNSGNIDITAWEGTNIITAGIYSYGILGAHRGHGGINITTHRGSSIITEGSNGHGIVAYHYGTGEDVNSDRPIIDITVGGLVNVRGPNSQGVRVGRVSGGNADRVATMFDSEGFRRQRVTVTGTVNASGENGVGILLAGGGRVVIGPQGSIRAASGLAIHATGDDPNSSDKPKLHVDFQLKGRRIVSVLPNGGYIVNDGGETTIVVNGVILHDGATGVTTDSNGDPVVARNGVWDVSIRQEGVKVTSRTTDPWTITDPATGVTTDRDFSAADFFEISDVYGPRGAVYEAVPNTLLLLNGWGNSAAKRLYSSDSPQWVGLTSGISSHKAAHSTIGGEFDLHRYEVEAGIDFPLSANLIGSVAGRLVSGTAKASSDTGGGNINAQGYGLSLSTFWSGRDGYYADGRFSATWIDMNLSSDADGGRGLKSNVDAFAHSLELEAGRRFALNDKTILTARSWMKRGNVSMDDFNDVDGSEVSLSGDATQFVGGVGGVVETVVWNDGGKKLSLSGSLGVESLLNDSTTNVIVSETPLISKSPNTTALLAGGVTCRCNKFTFHGGFQAKGLGSKHNEIIGVLEFGMHF